MKKLLTYLLFTSLVLFTSCSTRHVKKTEPERPSLRAQIDSLVNVAALSNAIVGINVRSLTTGDTLYDKNSNTSLIPASNLKLLTTATALKTLGPDFTMSTRLYFDGALQDSIFYGDLILRGGGDPTLVWSDSANGIPQLESLLNKLQLLGIRRIHGRLIGDDTFFDDQKYGIGWSWENDPYYFQPELSALSINQNCVNFIIHGDSIGTPAAIRLEPPFPSINVKNDITTSFSSSITIERDAGSNFFHAQGSIARGATLRRTRTIHNPAHTAIRYFAQLLNQAGIQCDSVFIIHDLNQFTYDPDSTLFLEIESPPLSQIVHDINKNSQNLDAELLLKLIGKQIKNDGSSRAGAQVVMYLLNEWGADTTGLNMVDGSGLSRKNLVTPAGFVAALTAMHSDSVFYHSLPMSGIDGTLDRYAWTRNRNVHAKTGTLDYVKALSGYIVTQSGDSLVFSFLVNHHLADTNKIIYIQNRFCQLLAQQ